MVPYSRYRQLLKKLSINKYSDGWVTIIELTQHNQLLHSILDEILCLFIGGKILDSIA